MIYCPKNVTFILTKLRPIYQSTNFPPTYSFYNENWDFDNIKLSWEKLFQPILYTLQIFPLLKMKGYLLCEILFIKWPFFILIWLLLKWRCIFFIFFIFPLRLNFMVIVTFLSKVTMNNYVSPQPKRTWLLIQHAETRSVWNKAEYHILTIIKLT